MKRIFKYGLFDWNTRFESDVVTIEMPYEAEILVVAMQGRVLCIWALVDPENKDIKRTFEVFGTGFRVDGIKRKFIGTAFMDQFVWHLFERV